jgi:hypothetical protein
MALVNQLNPSYDATKYNAKNEGLEAFTHGPQSDTVRSLSVATSHLGTLSQAIDALNNGNMNLVNKIGNKFAEETGGTAPTNFDAIKNVVMDEVTKAVLGSSGALGDRDSAVQNVNTARSPAQLRGVVNKYQQLMGGQLEGLGRQYKAATGLDNFDDFVSQLAKAQIPVSSLNVGDTHSVGGFTVKRVK